MRAFTCTLIAFGLAVTQAPAVQQPGVIVAKPQTTWGKIINVDNNSLLIQQYDPVTKSFAAKPQQIKVTPGNYSVFQHSTGNIFLPQPNGLQTPSLTKIGPDGVYARFGMMGNNLGHIYLYPNQAGWQQAIQTFPPPPGVPAPGK